MAVQRGLESSRPSGKRLFKDPFACSFVSPSWRIGLRAASFAPIRIGIEAAYDLIGGPGPRASAVVRTRLIDDLIEKYVDAADQIVILGAGFDTRPYRLRRLAGRRVFEVDHPDTQNAKRSGLTSALGSELCGVVFVPIDFETDDLTEALVGAGFSTEQATLFLWEGVTQYLSAEAVAATLRVIRNLSHPAGVLLFTYVDETVIVDGFADFPEAKRWLRQVQKRGEPWIFGIAPTEVARFLLDRGFELIKDVSVRDAGIRYLSAAGRHDYGSGLYHVVTARSLAAD
jgi:methyltransferase (TIGR00027 family)